MTNGQAQVGAADGVARGERDEPAIDRLPGLSKPARRALAAAGYTRLDQLATATEADLRALHGAGSKAIGVIRAALNERGRSFADAERG